MTEKTKHVFTNFFLQKLTFQDKNTAKNDKHKFLLYRGSRPMHWNETCSSIFSVGLQMYIPIISNSTPTEHWVHLLNADANLPKGHRAVLSFNEWIERPDLKYTLYECISTSFASDGKCSLQILYNGLSPSQTQQGLGLSMRRVVVYCLFHKTNYL